MFVRVAIVIAMLACILLGLKDRNPFWLSVTAGLAGFWILVMGLLMVEAGRVICPLCRTSYFKPLKNNRRSKRRFLGSARLAVARDMLFMRKRIHCLHCNEKIAWRGE